MKRSKRFKQSYRDTVNRVIDVYTLPSRTTKHRTKCAYMLGLGEIYEWSNGFRSTALLWKD